MGSIVVLSPKLSSETVPVQVDFISQLASGEAVSAVARSVVVDSGIDASPSAILSGAGSLSGSIFTQILTDGVDGVIYLISFDATTSLGNHLIINASLAVLDVNPYIL